MNRNTRKTLPNLLAMMEPDWESWARSQIWHVYEAMFLILGALPMIGYNGTKPMFALIVSHGDESTDKAVSRFFTLWQKLYRDVDDAAILQELPVIPKDREREEGAPHGWELHLVWDQEWLAMVTGSDGGIKWEPIPKDRIGVDVCLKRCRPADFLRWAESRGYDMPEELRPLLEDGEEQKKETPEERRERIYNWYQEEINERGERGALERVAKREGVKRQRISQIILKSRGKRLQKKT